MIRYSLTKNTMNPDTTEYIAKVKQWEKTDLNHILDYMVAEGSGLTRPQAIAYFEKLMQTIEYFIEKRGSLSIPLFRVCVTITGVFLDKDDTFDPKRHQINLRITPGARLKNLQSRLKVKKEIHRERTPKPELFNDLAGKSINKQASPGCIATIKGNSLKFNPEDDMQGIFFVPENNSHTKIRVDTYGEIRASEIHFLIPQLQAGNYRVIVQAIMQNHKSFRTGELGSIITVY